MKRILWGLMVWMLAVGTAQAALLGRVPLTPGGTDYQAYYDDDLNITWLADANYAETSGYASYAYRSWFQSQSWIGSLNAANHLGVNDWRLPETAQPDVSCSDQTFGSTWGFSGGYGCRGGEMGHLYYAELISSSSPGPFSNVMPNYYWSGTTYASDSSPGWIFAFQYGHLRTDFKSASARAWAVRDGDIAAVPAPGALWLFGTGVAALGAKLRRRVRGTVA